MDLESPFCFDITTKGKKYLQSSIAWNHIISDEDGSLVESQVLIKYHSSYAPAS